MNPAFRLNDDIFAINVRQGERVAKASLRFAETVTDGVVKEVYPLFARDVENIRRLGDREVGHSHAPEKDAGNILGTVDDVDRFHGASPKSYLTQGRSKT